MNKAYLILLSVFLLSSNLSCSSRKSKDYVFQEFSWLLLNNIYLNHPVACEENWYLIFDLTSEQIENFLSTDYSAYKYQGWEHYTGSRSIGNKKTVLIKGYTNNIMINLKEGCDPFNTIAMFIDLTEKRLILFYGITSRLKKR